MPLREANRVSFSSVECQRLLQALEIARDALRIRAGNAATPEEVEMAYEEASATFEQLREDILGLEVSAFKAAVDPPIEDR